MARLIDADKLLQHFYEKEYADMYCIEVVKRIINEQPTVSTDEVRGVVHCSDCSVPHNEWTGCPKLGGLVTQPDFYCAFGERMKGAEDGTTDTR